MPVKSTVLAKQLPLGAVPLAQMTVIAEGDGGLSAKSPSASVDATARRLTILIVTPEYTDDHQTERRLGDFSMLPKGIRLRLGYASTTVVHPDWQL